MNKLITRALSIVDITTDGNVICVGVCNLRTDGITPTEARQLAAMLTQAADLAENYKPETEVQS